MLTNLLECSVCPAVLRDMEKWSGIRIQDSITTIVT